MKNLAIVAMLLMAVLAACEEPKKSTDETTQEPAEKPAVEQPIDETTREPAEQPAAEQPADETPREPAEKPAAEQPADETPREPAEKPAAEQPGKTAPAENKVAPAEEPVERAVEKEVIAPPTISEDAPSEPHMGEPPSPSQPQPVYPEGDPGAAAAPKGKMEADKPTGEKAIEEEVMAPPTISQDAPSELHMGEPPSPTQPQPVYPEGRPGDAAEPKDMMETDEPARVEEKVIAPPTASEVAPSQPHTEEPPSPSQPQQVYPEDEAGTAAEPKDMMETDKPAEENAVEEELIAPPTASENGSSELHTGEPPSPSQPQPVYPEGEPSAADEAKDAMEKGKPAGEAVGKEEVMEESIVPAPTAPGDGSSEGTMGEAPFPSQPQPVYPEGKPGDAAQP